MVSIPLSGGVQWEYRPAIAEVHHRPDRTPSFLPYTRIIAPLPVVAPGPRQILVASGLYQINVLFA